MAFIAFLIIFPLVAAAALALVRAESARRIIVLGAGAIIGIASIAFIVTALPAYGGKIVLIAFDSEIIDHIGTGITILIAVVVLYFAWRYKNFWAGIIATIQVVLALVVETLFAHQLDVPYGLYFDGLSLLMTFIIGVIGSAICIYALGYMEDFQKHEPEGARDRRPFFFALMFVFLSAMYVIVFSNNLIWLFTGWEVTTVCSFLLIGYTRTEEAIRNAFRQIIMNMAGGIGFAIAIYCCTAWLHTVSLYEFIAYGSMAAPGAALVAVFLGFAGITKAAQMPFQTWLLGAMVAPTPTSALLHSSTMVKAGVFLLVKLAPVFAVCEVPSIMVMLVGGITFMMCSFLAISQSNGKRVLAYSTIANLGLITACAGVGTPEAVWAACFLILFHALAKSLLFMCVGTAEHHIGSRDIEDMDLLFDRMPRLARFMMLGIMGMFIAPFGMLIAKWATLVSFVDTGEVALIIILAFGSAATFMFWAKWLGKLAGIAGSPENVELDVHKTEWGALLLTAVLTVAACVLLPLLSYVIVEPYVVSVYGVLGQDIASDNLWIASICVIFVVVVLFGGIGSKKTRRVSVYLAGVGDNHDERTFRNSLSGITTATARNWYMEDFFGEARVAPIGVWASVLVMVVAVILAFVGVGFGVPVLM